MNIPLWPHKLKYFITHDGHITIHQLFQHPTLMYKNNIATTAIAFNAITVAIHHALALITVST